jgi:hypothetical protein
MSIFLVYRQRLTWLRLLCYIVVRFDLIYISGLSSVKILIRQPPLYIYDSSTPRYRHLLVLIFLYNLIFLTSRGSFRSTLFLTVGEPTR